MSEKAPRVYLKNGKKYFKVNGKRVVIKSKMTEKDLISIYKLLKKNTNFTNARLLAPVRGKKTQIINSAKAVVNLHNPPAKRRRRRVVTKKPFVSTINEANRISTSGPTAYRHPKDSGKEDEINKLINEKAGLSNQLIVSNNRQAPQQQMSEQEIMYEMNQDPRFHYYLSHADPYTQYKGIKEMTKQ